MSTHTHAVSVTHLSHACHESVMHVSWICHHFHCVCRASVMSVPCVFHAPIMCLLFVHNHASVSCLSCVCHGSVMALSWLCHAVHTGRCYGYTLVCVLVTAVYHLFNQPVAMNMHCEWWQTPCLWFRSHQQNEHTGNCWLNKQCHYWLIIIMGRSRGNLITTRQNCMLPFLNVPVNSNRKHAIFRHELKCQRM